MAKEPRGNDGQMKDTLWRCSNCKMTLGVVSSSGDELRLKYKDFYAIVKRGDVTVLCRRCGRVNILSDQEELYLK